MPEYVYRICQVCGLQEIFCKCSATNMPKETFPRGPSNEQTLLTELGQARATIFEMTKVAIKSAAEYVAIEKERDGLKAQLTEVQENLEDEQDSGDSAYAADTKRIYEIRELTAERDKLQAFKDWVHAYLDNHGVPHHPPGPHGAEGCRIGDRMDWLMAKLANAEQAVDHIAAEDKAERDALAVTAERQAEQIRRLRESLEWALKQRLSTWCSQDHERARAILKETAP